MSEESYTCLWCEGECEGEFCHFECEALYLKKENRKLKETLKFYADPDTYFAIAFFPDHPCGDFINDFSECHHEDLGTVIKPGKKAREALIEG